MIPSLLHNAIISSLARPSYRRAFFEVFWAPQQFQESRLVTAVYKRLFEAGNFPANNVSSARYHVCKLGFLKVGLDYSTSLCKREKKGKKKKTLVKLQSGESEILGCCTSVVTITQKLK